MLNRALVCTKLKTLYFGGFGWITFCKGGKFVPAKGTVKQNVINCFLKYELL